MWKKHIGISGCLLLFFPVVILTIALGEILSSSTVRLS